MGTSFYDFCCAESFNLEEIVSQKYIEFGFELNSKLPLITLE